MLSQLYNLITNARNSAYDVGFVDCLKLKTPVISVGNLTVGGTGKTPITQMLVQYYIHQGKKPSIVGRNYKAILRGSAQVDALKPSAAQFYGDEPTLMALNNPGVPVFVGPMKWKTAGLAERATSPDVIVIDDGFQHRALYRDLDIVLLDATVPLEDYQLLPRGKAREPISALERADYVLLTKVNLADEQKLEKIKSLLPANLKVLEVAYRLGDQVENAGKKAIAFSGLARPESFKKSIQQDTLYELLEFVSFPDHHKYTQKDVDYLIRRKNELGADVLLMTEKDKVKIKDFAGTENSFHTLSLQTYFLSPVEEFHASLDKVLR